MRGIGEAGMEREEEPVGLMYSRKCLGRTR